MKNHSILKIIRVIVAILIIIPLTFLFIDFAGYDLSSVYWLTKIQVTPAIMGTIAGASAGLVLLSLFVITLIGGRIYCSVICPFGIMQDIIGRISNLFKRKKKKRRVEKEKREINGMEKKERKRKERREEKEREKRGEKKEEEGKREQTG